MFNRDYNSALKQTHSKLCVCFNSITVDKNNPYKSITVNKYSFKQAVIFQITRSQPIKIKTYCFIKIISGDHNTHADTDPVLYLLGFVPQHQPTFIIRYQAIIREVRLSVLRAITDAVFYWLIFADRLHC